MFLNKNTRIEECNDSREILILLFVIKILVMRSSVACRISNESLVKRGNVYQEVFVVVIRKQKKRLKVKKTVLFAMFGFG